MIADHHNKYNNNEKFEISQELPKCDTETLSEKMFLEKNGADRLVQHRVATNLQFVKMQYLGSTINWNAIKWSMPVLKYKLEPSKNKSLTIQYFNFSLEF